MILGLSGRKGSGKDTVGAHLVREHGFVRLAFADVLKESAAAALGVTVDLIEELKNEPAARVTLVAPFRPRKYLSVRAFLQRYGTEAHRAIFGDDFWRKAVIDKLGAHENVVVTDVRFEDEAEALQAHGATIIEVRRPSLVDDGDQHPSERVPAVGRSIVLSNSGTIEELQRGIDAFLAALPREPE